MFSHLTGLADHQIGRLFGTFKAGIIGMTGCAPDFWGSGSRFKGLQQMVSEKQIPRPIVVGETGCLVRLINPPFEMLDVKYSMGSSIGIASGL